MVDDAGSLPMNGTKLGTGTYPARQASIIPLTPLQRSSFLDIRPSRFEALPYQKNRSANTQCRPD
jgi:hypothetical protein